MAALVLAWVIDRPVGYQPDECYILAVTRGIQTLPDMYRCIPSALGPAALRQSGIHIRQSLNARVTTITY